MLFEHGSFVLHSGSKSDWRINCENLTDVDWEVLAKLVARTVGLFGNVEGVPTGGLKLAEALSPYVFKRYGPLLIVDDVLTTGKSMEEQRNGREAMGIVVFARGPTPSWVKSIFTMNM